MSRLIPGVVGSTELPGLDQGQMLFTPGAPQSTEKLYARVGYWVYSCAYTRLPTTVYDVYVFVCIDAC